MRPLVCLQVVALHEVMLASGLTPDAPTAALVLSAALSAGQTRKALALANTLQVGACLRTAQPRPRLAHCEPHVGLPVQLSSFPPSFLARLQVQGFQLEAGVLARLAQVRTHSMPPAEGQDARRRGSTREPEQ